MCVFTEHLFHKPEREEKREGPRAGFLQADHAQHCPDKDAEHGGGGGEHGKEDIPDDSTDFKGHIRPVKVKPADSAERFCVRRNRWLVLFYPGHTKLTILMSVYYCSFLNISCCVTIY